ncbi:MAG: RHS repeat-associated core domain-containing protein [Candidatus Komeilibacteria bacterium]|nr:RHS repeat-associated core domain-containing protein [Candidatus Komeilibacteria bacterium]
MEQNIGGGLHVAAYQYTGKEKDAETGLYNYGARYYEVGTGRFIQPDELSKSIPYNYLIDPQKLNEYAYVTNNPIVKVDPDGRVGILVVPLFMAGVWLVNNMPAIITTISALVGGSYMASETGAAAGSYIEGDTATGNQHIKNAMTTGAGVALTAGESVIIDNAAKKIQSKQTKTATGKQSPETSGVENNASKPKLTNTQTIIPGQQITSAEQVPENIRNSVPQSWGAGSVSQNEKGWRWQDPKSQAYVRFGTGDPNSSFPNSQSLYVKINNANGQPLDKNGNVIIGYNSPSNAPDAHIPLNEFNPNNYSFLNQ